MLSSKHCWTSWRWWDSLGAGISIVRRTQELRVGLGMLGKVAWGAGRLWEAGQQLGLWRRLANALWGGCSDAAQ